MAAIKHVASPAGASNSGLLEKGLLWLEDVSKDVGSRIDKGHTRRKSHGDQACIVTIEREVTQAKVVLSSLLA
jgi:hypothetical protein